MVEVRYFAAIADLTGRNTETLALSGTSTVADLRHALTARYGADMDRLLAVCAYLIGDELTRDPATRLGPDVDVLPPFAGG